MARGRLACVFALSLLGNALSVPLDAPRWSRGFNDNELDSAEVSRGDVGASTFNEPSKVPMNPAITLSPVISNYEEKKKEYQTPDPFDDDDDFAEPMQTSSTAGGGSNIVSLLNLVSGLFPGSSGANFQVLLRRMIRELIRNPQPYLLRRQDSIDNEIEIDYPFNLKPPPFQRQESDENESDSGSDSNDTNDSSESEEDNAAEESVEDNDNGDNNASQQNSDSKADGNGDGDGDGDDNDSDYDSDEPPEGGDGQGGGVLGLLAGLSGGEDGQSDLGSLLAAVSGIVVNLSGDGLDLNSLIASGLGLFVGLLSEGEQNPGEIIASYLLTSLETITGGGSKNNGAFFGKFISKLISGTSMGESPEDSSDESGEAEGMKDSAGFLLSLLMGLSGEMSKGSSKPW